MQQPLTHAPSAEGFFGDSWALYSAILDHNYMFHREIFQNVRGVISAHCDAHPRSLLDLGCGDARYLAAALDGLPISRYVAYDLAATALEYAGRNLASLACPIELRQGDLLEALRADDECFDILFSSFALHHLAMTQKAEFFQLAARRMSAGGLLILIDVVRDEGEDRDRYLDRYCGWASSSWTALPTAGVADVCAHIRESDFPEWPSCLRDMALTAGFCEFGYQPAFGAHQTLIWQNRGFLGASSA
jgi:SAM-dependent methyltransferase